MLKITFYQEPSDFAIITNKIWIINKKMNKIIIKRIVQILLTKIYIQKIIKKITAHFYQHKNECLIIIQTKHQVHVNTHNNITQSTMSYNINYQEHLTILLIIKIQPKITLIKSRINNKTLKNSYSYIRTNNTILLNKKQRKIRKDLFYQNLNDSKTLKQHTITTVLI